MEFVTIPAYAKLNLTLSVLSRRADGYHDLESLMQSVSLFDTVTVRRARDVTVTAVGMRLPYDNTMRRAAERYYRETGRGATVHAVKRIPAEAGLGGGSADAAAVLLALQRLYDEPDDAALNEMALSVGADVPFCLHAQRGGSLALARGVGEALTPLAPVPMYFVIARAWEGVSTRALFTALSLPCENADTAAALAALSASDLPALGGQLKNALEPPAAKLVPEIAALKEKLMHAGALGACMTGSGSAVFGLFASAEAARAALPAVADASFSCVCRAR